MEILSGKDLYEVAEEHQISLDKVCQLYESAIRIINRNQEFFRSYRTKLAGLELEVRKLQIQNRNQKEHIKTLHTVFDKTRFLYKLDKYVTLEQADEDIPWLTVKLLSLNLLTELNLETRIKNCLRTLGIITVEDLLRYIKRGGGMRCLSGSRNFGAKSCKTLILELEKIGVMDSDGDSQLFKYIE
ncbi:DNA-directed RNA polymerase subunit alpha C-terminal domain-containing protein [Bacteroides fragilis]|nr:DNA-directed RNA polymerase subunit alpha C-terminal domain-containing protein [Bacteroides fragilis]